MTRSGKTHSNKGRADPLIVNKDPDMRTCRWRDREGTGLGERGASIVLEASRCPTWLNIGGHDEEFEFYSNTSALKKPWDGKKLPTSGLKRREEGPVRLDDSWHPATRKTTKGRWGQQPWRRRTRAESRTWRKEVSSSRERGISWLNAAGATHLSWSRRPHLPSSVHAAPRPWPSPHRNVSPDMSPEAYHVLICPPQSTLLSSLAISPWIYSLRSWTQVEHFTENIFPRRWKHLKSYSPLSSFTAYVSL